MVKVFIIIIILLLLSCDIFKYEKDIDFDNLFTVEKTIEVPDSIKISYFIFGVSFLGDSAMVFSELMTKSFYMLNFNNSIIKNVGEKGMGPGEFNEPKSTMFINDTIYLYDISKPKYLTLFNSKLEYIKELFFYDEVVGVNTIKNYNKEFYFYSSSFSSHYITSKSHKYFNVPILFSKDRPVKHSPGMVILEDTLYFMNYYEPKIYKLDLITKKESSILLSEIQDNIWENIKDNNIIINDLDKKLNENYVFNGFDAFKFEGKNYFNIFAQSNSLKTMKNEYFITDSNGKIKFRYFCKDGFILKVNTNTGKFINIMFKDDKIIFKQLTIKNNLL